MRWKSKITCWQYLHQKFSYQFEQCWGKRRGIGSGIEWGRRRERGWGILKSSFLDTVSSVPKLALGSLCRLWGRHLPREIVPKKCFWDRIYQIEILPDKKCMIGWLGRVVSGVFQCESLEDRHIRSAVESTVATPVSLDFPDPVLLLSPVARSDLIRSTHYSAVALASIANHFHS